MKINEKKGKKSLYTLGTKDKDFESWINGDIDIGGAVQCGAVQCRIVHYIAVQCSVLQCSIVQCRAVHAM